jgi:pyruvate dehydrogenase E2 component (dihydrolipoamide acetyltransferase)
VKAGDVIAEIETDKATMEVEAVDEGTLGRILVPEGAQGVKVNAPIALLLSEGEDTSALDKGARPAAAPEAPKPVPGAGNGAQAGPQPRPAPAPPPPAPAPRPAAPPRADGERIFASPLAKRMAAQAGLDLAHLSGSGPRGRIVKADIEAALARGPVAEAAPRPAAPPIAPPAAPPVAGLPPFVEQPHTNIRKTIARRLSEAKREQPHFYLTIDCEIDKLLEIRKELNGRSDKYKLSVNDFIIRASALALMQVPAANASWTEQALRLYQSADISVAVAIPAGLITPIVRGAERKGLAAISNEMKDLVQRAREGKLKPEEYQGGTFSISNLGMYGVSHFAAVINPPEAAILAVGAVQRLAVVRGDAVVPGHVLKVTMSCDHRVIDGAVAAQFLATLRDYVEHPMRLVL